MNVMPINYSNEADRLGEILKQYSLDGDSGMFVQ